MEGRRRPQLQRYQQANAGFHAQVQYLFAGGRQGQGEDKVAVGIDARGRDITAGSDGLIGAQGVWQVGLDLRNSWIVDHQHVFARGCTWVAQRQA